MIFYYLDASAWVKRYYYEDGTDWVCDLFTHKQITACSSFGLVEVIATLARKHKAQMIGTHLFERKVAELDKDCESFINIQLTDEVIITAKNLAKELALRGADAIHLASALILQRYFIENDDQVILVTSDYELNEAAQKKGIIVIDPSE